MWWMLISNDNGSRRRWLEWQHHKKIIQMHSVAQGWENIYNRKWRKLLDKKLYVISQHAECIFCLLLFTMCFSSMHLLHINCLWEFNKIHSIIHNYNKVTNKKHTIIRCSIIINRKYVVMTDSMLLYEGGL